MYNNYKLSKEQQFIEKARKKTLELEIANSKKLAEYSKNIDTGVIPEIIDTRSFAEIQDDEVLMKERVAQNCNKLVKSPNEGYKLATMVFEAQLEDIVVERFAELYKAINDKGVRTAREAFYIIQDMEQGNSNGIDKIALLSKLIIAIDDLIPEITMDSTRYEQLKQMKLKLDAYRQVLIATGGIERANSKLPNIDELEELLYEILNYNVEGEESISNVDISRDDLDDLFYEDGAEAKQNEDYLGSIDEDEAEANQNNDDDNNDDEGFVDAVGNDKNEGFGEAEYDDAERLYNAIKQYDGETLDDYISSSFSLTNYNMKKIEARLKKLGEARKQAILFIILRRIYDDEGNYDILFSNAQEVTLKDLEIIGFGSPEI